MIYGLLSGIGYIIGFIASPQTMLTSLPSYIIIMGYTSHMLLLLEGLLACFKVKKYPLKDIYTLYIFLIQTLIFAYLVKIKVFYPDATNLNSLVIIKLVDGSLLEYLGITNDSLWLKILVSGGVYITNALFLLVIAKINNKITKKIVIYSI